MGCNKTGTIDHRYIWQLLRNHTQLGLDKTQLLGPKYLGICAHKLLFSTNPEFDIVDNKDGTGTVSTIIMASFPYTLQNLIPCFPWIAPTPSTLAQSTERKGSNFAIWQHCYKAQAREVASQQLRFPRRSSITSRRSSSPSSTSRGSPVVPRRCASLCSR